MWSPGVVNDISGVNTGVVYGFDMRGQVWECSHHTICP